LRRRFLVGIISLGGVILLGLLLRDFGGRRGKDEFPTATVRGKELRIEGWLVGPKMPVKLSEIAAVAVNNVIFVAGGLMADGRASDLSFIFDPLKGEWRYLAPLPKPLHHLSVVGRAGEVFAIGGYDDRWMPQDAVYEYRLTEDSWSLLTKLPRPVAAATAQLIGSEIHLFGGARGGLALNEHIVLDIETGVVRTETPLRVAREHLTSAALGDSIFIVGGRTTLAGRMLNLDDLEIYDSRKRTLRFGPPMPTPRSGLAAATAGGKVFVFGGESETETFGDVDVFDVNTFSWYRMARMPTPRHGLGAVALDNRIYVLAGGPKPGLSVSDVNEILVLGEG
jgi:N-acetylneuraminic acid mutarotase